MTSFDGGTWNALAKHYGMAVEEPKTMWLAQHMPAQQEVWRRIDARHDLLDTPYAEFAGWRLGDMIFHSDWDNVSSTIKLRHAGFPDSFDTERRLLDLLDELGERRIIAPARA